MRPEILLGQRRVVFPWFDFARGQVHIQPLAGVAFVREHSLLLVSLAVVKPSYA